MSKLTNLVLHIQAALEDKPLIVEESAISQILETKESERLPENVKDSPLTKKEQVINAILHRSHEVQVEDLPSVEEEMLAYFNKYKNGDYFNDLNSEDYYRLLNLNDKPDARVVVVGDIHCDYNSLAAILLKLSVSSYDYFENGYFVFMGDYLDRGAMLFEPLLLLMDLKEIIGERMILLRGNHELISYNEDEQILEGRVVPQDSVPCLNEYCGENKQFLEAFGNFYQTLPTYVYLKVKDQNVLLTHGGIPRQIFWDAFSFDQNTGAIVFEDVFMYLENKKVEESILDDSLKAKTVKLNANILNTRNKILHDMIWGDPSNDEEKYQVAGRFQFGRKQFEAYAKKNRLSRVFRSHEPVEYGYTPFYDNQLFTIFSTGGNDNEQSGYADVQPAFAIIDAEGKYEIENSYIYRVVLSGVIDLIIDLFTESIIRIQSAGKYALNAEFCCTAEDALKIRGLFTNMIEAFTTEEEQVEEQDETAPQEEASPETIVKESEELKEETEALASKEEAVEEPNTDIIESTATEEEKDDK